MNNRLIDFVAGARPNFMKLAPVVRETRKRGILKYRIIHTGQHYDDSMNKVFFEELGIPMPDIHLEVGSGSHGAQTARILERYEAHLLQGSPAATVVFGDVNSTIACALASVKLGIPVAHVEAGLRSGDRSMPEEINRLLTDTISGLLLVTDPSGLVNLEREGIPKSRVRFVGNVMIDTLFRYIDEARDMDLPARMGLPKKGYGLVTLHRPSNVDEKETLLPLLEVLHEISTELPLVFPVHPRTLAAARRMGIDGMLAEGQRRFICLGPLPYTGMLSLVSDSAMVLTDSGGLQEETSVLKVPCLTLRENTERPVTVEIGTSRLVGNDPARIRQAFRDVLSGDWAPGQEIPMWDGRAAERISIELEAWLSAPA